jgi:hypothetical protein
MSALFATGHAVDLILLLVAVEAACALAWHRHTGRGLSPAAILSLLLPGVFLLLALRGALVNAGWGWIALALLAAFAAHLQDLARRWRRQTNTPSPPWGRGLG